MSSAKKRLEEKIKEKRNSASSNVGNSVGYSKSTPNANVKGVAGAGFSALTKAMTDSPNTFASGTTSAKERLQKKLESYGNRGVDSIDAAGVDRWLNTANESLYKSNDYIRSNRNIYNPNFGAEQKTSLQDALKSSFSVARYLDNHKDELSNYDALREQLSIYQSDIGRQLNNIKGFQEYYSQWENEEAYNTEMAEYEKYLKEQAKIEAMPTLDLDAEYKALEEKKTQLEEYKKAKKDLEYVNSLTPNQLRNEYAAQNIENRKRVAQNTLNKYKGIDMDALEYELSQQEEYLGDAQKVQSSRNTTLETMRQSDFEELSKVAKENATSTFGINTPWGRIADNGDRRYDYINDLGYAQTLYPDDTEGLEKYSTMTEDEVAVYNYLYNKEGKESADKYLDELDNTLNDRHMVKYKERWEEFATKLPVFSSALSVPANLIGGGLGYLDVASQHIANAFTGEDKPIDYNRGGMKASVMSSTVRETVSKNIADATGIINLDEKEHPVLSKLLNGKSLGDVYQLGMSMADSATVAFVTKATGLNPVFGSMLLGGSAATQGVLDAVERGATDEEAFMMGTLNGVFEGLFERYSIDNLVNGNTRNIVKSFLKQGAIEGSEEVFTSFANNIADILVMAEKSGYRKNVEAYIEAGMNREQANTQALLDAAVDLGWDFIGGFLSGGIMGSVNTAIGNHQTKTFYGDNGSTAILDEALEIDPEDEYAKKLKERVEGGKKLRAEHYATLFDKNSEKLLQQDEKAIKGAVSERLTTLGETGNIEALSEVLLKQAKGERLNSYDKSLLANSKYGQRVSNELNTKNIEEGGYSSEWAENIGTNSIGPDFYNRIVEDVETEEAPEGKSIEDITRPKGANEVLAKYAAENKLNEKTADFKNRLEEKTESNKKIEALNVSDDGKTIHADEEVEIEEVASVKGGKMVLRLANGKNVSADSVSYPSGDDAVLYGTVQELATNSSQANEIINGFKNSGLNVSTYTKGVRLAHLYGTLSLPLAEIEKRGSVSKLPLKVRNAAYKAGMVKSGKDVAKATAIARNPLKTARGTTRNGGVFFGLDSSNVSDIRDYIKSEGKTLNATQESGVVAMEMMSKALGVEYYVFESYLNKDGDRVYIDENGNEVTAPNGYYENNKVYIDLNAGAKGDGLMLYTVAHEMTHFIRKWSPSKFKVLANAVIEHSARRGQSIEDLVASQIAKAERDNRTISEDEALEEVIADSMETILADGKVLEMMTSIKQKDESLWGKIKEWFKDLANKLKSIVSAYEGTTPDSYEGKMVANMKDIIGQLESIYAEGLIEAGVNYNAAEDIKNTASEDGVTKLQARMVNGKQVVWIEDNILKTNQGLPVHQFIANYIAEHIGDVYRIIESGQKVYIGTDLPSEYTQSNYTKNILKHNRAISNAKKRAASNLGEMIEIATNRRWEKTKHKKNKDAKYGMYRYDTSFGFPVLNVKGEINGANIYKAELVIRNASDGKKYLYDIVNIKKDTFTSEWLTKKVTRATAYADVQKENVFNDSIRNPEQNVNKKYSNRDSEGAILTEKQQEYFKDSLVRDSEGNLQVVYHGTRSGNFTVFNHSLNYFTNNREMADSYSPNGDIYEGYLNITKPFEIDANGEKWSGIPISNDLKSFLESYGSSVFKEKGKWRTTPADIADAIMTAVDEGDYDYDGIIIRNVDDTGSYYKSKSKNIGDDFITFNSNQFKNRDNIEPTKDKDIRYSVRAEFNEEIDAWDGKSNTVFNVGTTSNVLKSIGVKDTGIIWHGKKIAEILRKHKNMTKGIIKQVPQILEDPIIILSSKNSESRLVMFGSVNDENGTPVTAILELLPTNKGGQVIDLNVIASAYGKDNTRNFIETSGLVYLNPNKKRTNNWLSAVGLQLPSVAPNHYGSIGSVTYQEGKVKIDSTPYNQYMSSGGKKYSYHDLDSDIRYSTRDPDAVKVARALRKENDNLKTDIARLKELLKLQGSVTDGKKFTRSSVEKSAQRLKTHANAKGNTTELADMLNTYYEYIASADELTWEGVMDEATPIAEWLHNNRVKNNELDPYAKEILDEIRKTKVSFNDTQKAEAKYMSGTWKSYRDSMMGSVVISDNANVTLDELWNSLAEKYPAEFDEQTSANDMPRLLFEKVQELRNMRHSDSYDVYDEQLIIQDLVNEIYDSYWRVSTLYTVADKNQKVINELKSKHYQQMESYKAKIENLKAEHKEEIENVRKKAQEEFDKKEQNIRDTYEERISREKDSAQKRAIKQKIRRTIMDLNKLFNKGDKKKNVKEEMKSLVSDALLSYDILYVEANLIENEDLLRVGVDDVAREDEKPIVSKALELLNMRDSAKTEDEAKKLDKKLKYQMSKLSAVFKAKRTKISETRAGDVLNSLSESYRLLDKSEHSYINEAYKEEVYQYLVALNGDIGGTPVRDMTANQLEELYQAYKMILTAVKNANGLFAKNLKESREVLANKALAELDSMGKISAMGKLSSAASTFTWNNLKPIYAFEKIGSDTLMKLYKNVRDGQNVWAKDFRDADEFRKAVETKYGYNKWDMKKTYPFTSSSGTKFELSLPQIMSIYAYSKREAALKHLTNGGIVFESGAEVYVNDKGFRKVFLNNDATTHKLSADLLSEIISDKYITKEQKAYVDEMQNYLSTTMGSKGNEVSMQLYGVNLYGEENYFPLRSAGQYNDKAKETNLQKEQGQVTLVNAGFSKKLTPGANNPIVLSNFNEVWSGHVTDMSMYHAFVLPLEDFRKIYNYKTPNYEGQESYSVNSLLQNAHGAAAVRYVDQLIKDVNGGVLTDPRESIGKNLISKFKKSAVMASASVVIQQPSAIGRAFAEINPKYFLGERLTIRKHKEVWEEVKKYSPVAFIKEMGYFDVGMGKGPTDYLMTKEYDGVKDKAKALFKDKEYRGKKLDDAFGKLPALADELTWCAIWNAVKREVKANNPNLAVNSEEFLNKCGERFTDIIDKTQVYDSVFSRSANMRSKTVHMNMLTSFLAEPTTSINMLGYALDKIKRGDKKKAIKTIASVYASVLLNSMLVSLVYAARDDDEDETFLEKYVSSFSVEMLEGLNPITYLPFIKDIWSIMQGYDVERADMSIVSDLTSKMTNLIKLWSTDTSEMSEDNLKAHNEKLTEAYWGVLDYTAAMFGLPMKNIRRDINGAFNLTKTLGEDFGGRETSWGSLMDKTWENVKKSLPVIGWMPNEKKTDKLYRAIINGDTVYANRIKGSYGTESALENALKKALQDNDPRVIEAAIASYEGNNVSLGRLAKEIIGEGNFSQQIVMKAINSEENKLEPDDNDGSASKTKLGIYDMDNFAKSVIKGDSVTARIKEDIINTKVKNGSTREDAEKSFISSAKTKIKDLYLEGDINEAKVISTLTNYCDMDIEEADEWLEKIDFSAEYGFSYSDKKRAYQNGEISSAELVDILVNYEGKSREEALEEVAELDYEIEYPELSKTIGYSYYKKWEAEGKVYGVDFEVFTDVATFRDDGSSKSATSQDEVWDYINSLNISKTQKDGLHLCFWKESTLKNAPWNK